MKARKNYITTLVAWVVFLAGVINMYSAFYSGAVMHLRRWETDVPFTLTHTSRTVIFLAGLMLVSLARGLFLKKYRAWLAAMVLLGITFLTHLFRPGYSVETVVMASGLALLWITRFEFTVQSASAVLARRLLYGVALLFVIFLYAWGGFFLLQGQFTQKVTWHAIVKDYGYTVLNSGQDELVPLTNRAKWFEDSIEIVTVALLVWILYIVFGPNLLESVPSEEEFLKAQNLLRQYGDAPISFLTLMPGKQFYFGKSVEGFVSFTVHAGTAVALGDPVAEKSSIKKLAEEFYLSMQKRGLSAAFYQTALPEMYKGLGLRVLKIGDDAVIELGEFNLASPELKNVRNSVTKIAREGVTFRWCPAALLPWKELSAIESLHAAWEKKHGGKPLGFSMNFYPFPPEEQIWVLTAWQDHKLAGVFSFFPYDRQTSYSLDAMMRAEHAPNGLVEAATAEAVTHFKNLGCKTLSLGLATLTGEKSRASSPLAQKAIETLYQNLGRWYRYSSLTFFKQKFKPAWQPRFLAYASDTELPKVGMAIFRAHTHHD